MDVKPLIPLFLFKLTFLLLNWVEEEPSEDFLRISKLLVQFFRPLCLFMPQSEKRVNLGWKCASFFPRNDNNCPQKIPRKNTEHFILLCKKYSFAGLPFSFFLYKEIMLLYFILFAECTHIWCTLNKLQ